MTPPPSPGLATRLHAVTAQIRDMAGKATEGPWHFDYYDVPLAIAAEPDESGERDVVRPWSLAHPEDNDNGTELCLDISDANAAYITNMSPDIAILIADVMDAVASRHFVNQRPGICVTCSIDFPCADLTAWLPLVEAFEARR